MLAKLLLLVIALWACTVLSVAADDNKEIELLLQKVSGKKDVDPLTSLQDTVAQLESLGSQLKIDGSSISLAAPAPSHTAHAMPEDTNFLESHKASAKQSSEAETETETEAEAEESNEVEAEAEAEAALETSDDSSAAPKAIHLRRGARSMLESSSSKPVAVQTQEPQWHGHGISHVPRGVKPHRPAPRLTGAATKLTRSNVRCVLCQYFLQRVHADMTSSPEIKNPVLLETDSNDAALVESQSRVLAEAENRERIEAIVSADAEADAKKNPAFFDQKTKQQRAANTNAVKPASMRFASLATADGDANSKARVDAARAAYQKLYSGVYASFETLCARRMPLAYLPYCNDMLKSYRYFAQGLHYGDRPETICMNGNFCDKRSYIRFQPHVTYTPEAGDA